MTNHDEHDSRADNSGTAHGEAPIRATEYQS